MIQIRVCLQTFNLLFLRGDFNMKYLLALICSLALYNPSEGVTDEAFINQVLQSGGSVERDSKGNLKTIYVVNFGDLGNFPVSKTIKNIYIAESVCPKQFFINISQCETLTTLSLFMVELADPSAIMHLRSNSISNFVIYHTPLRDVELNHLSELKNLSDLDISECSIRCDFLSLFRSDNNIHSLSLSKTFLNDKNFSYLSKFKNLETLDVSSTEISDNAIESLSKLRNLTHLNLSSTSLNGHSFNQLPNNLVFLDISDTSVKNEQVNLLKDLSKLQYLNLSKTSISNDTNLTFADKIEILDISNTFINENSFFKLNRYKLLKGINLINSNVVLTKNLNSFKNIKLIVIDYKSLLNDKFMNNLIFTLSMEKICVSYNANDPIEKIDQIKHEFSKYTKSKQSNIKYKLINDSSSELFIEFSKYLD